MRRLISKLGDLVSWLQKDREFNAFEWNFYYRPLLSILGGLLATLIIYVAFSYVRWQLDLEMSMSLGLWLLVLVLFSLLFAAPESNEPERVPETRFSALMTWLGMPLNWQRTTGTYPWRGARLGFGRSDKFSENFTDPDGFIITGEIPFQVWNSAADRQKSERTIIVAPAKNRAEIRASITLVLQLENPRKMLDSDDPALDIGERARQEFREMVRKFVDTDVPDLQHVTADILVGRRMITSFIPKAEGGHKLGAMIRDTADNAMFTMVREDETEDHAIQRFLRELAERANPKMLKLITAKKDDGSVEIKVDRVQIAKPIEEVIHAVGMRLKRVTFGDIILSEPVTAAANAASAEEDERISQIASAKTMREVRKSLKPTPTELLHPELFQLAVGVAAAQDDKSDSIKVVLVPSGNPLATAAVAAATQIGGNQ